MMTRPATARCVAHFPHMARLNEMNLRVHFDFDAGTGITHYGIENVSFIFGYTTSSTWYEAVNNKGF